MTSSEQGTSKEQLVGQRALWRGQASSIPGLLGGKAAWLPLALELVQQVNAGRVLDPDATADLSFNLESVEARQGGAVPRLEPATWREYFGFLRGLRLAENFSGAAQLTTTGKVLAADPTSECLAAIMADRIRLFAEVLSLIAEEPRTVVEVDDQVQARYGQSWRSKGSTRARMDWQEVLGLIETIGNRRWQITPAGRALLEDRIIVTPAALDDDPERVVEVPSPPAEIAELLDELTLSNRTHESRNTYNIWVPSPSSSPDKVENLRTIINAAVDKIEREELFSFICQTFDLKRSSVESMLPFMRASGVLAEIARGVFRTTPAAKAWVDSGDNINFIRILHANMRFVGEMIRAVEDEITRAEMYAEAALFGLNIDKCRWIASFLLGTGLIEEPRYGSLRATPRGLALAAELPLADLPRSQEAADQEHLGSPRFEDEPVLAFREELGRLSRVPHADGKGSGRAFEEAIRDTFIALGFSARVISGSGDTDVLVKWHDSEGSLLSATIEAKARSAGYISHTDVSDVAIETHRSRHKTKLVAVIGPGFSGDTIKNMAAHKGWVLLEAERLGMLAETSVALGLRPYEIGKLFQVPNGLVDLEDLIATRERELGIVSFLLLKLVEEARDTGEAISARDISRDGRRAELAPRVEEVVAAIGTLTQLQISAVRQVDAADDPRFETYVIGDALAGATRLRALAHAIEQGLGPGTSSSGK